MTEYGSLLSSLSTSHPPSLSRSHFCLRVSFPLSSSFPISLPFFFVSLFLSHPPSLSLSHFSPHLFSSLILLPYLAPILSAYLFLPIVSISLPLLYPIFHFTLISLTFVPPSSSSLEMRSTYAPTPHMVHIALVFITSWMSLFLPLENCWTRTMKTYVLPWRTQFTTNCLLLRTKITCKSFPVYSSTRATGLARYMHMFFDLRSQSPLAKRFMFLLAGVQWLFAASRSYIHRSADGEGGLSTSSERPTAGDHPDCASRLHVPDVLRQSNGGQVRASSFSRPG